MVGSRLEYDSLITKIKNNKIEISVEVRTSSSDGIIFYSQQFDSTDIMAVYLKERNVI